MVNFQRKSGPTETVNSLKDLLIAYAKQETIDPLRSLGRYLGFGLAGAVLMALGIILLAVGALRALQTETGSTFTGSLTWVPYLIVLAGLVVAIWVLSRMITKGRSR